MNIRNKKKFIQDSENVIRKSNEFSIAEMSYGLTLNQLQLLAYAIFATQKTGKTEFHKADFEKKFEIGEYRTALAKKDSEILYDLKTVLYDEKKDIFRFRHIFDKMDYERGLFTFTWKMEFLPHILDLKERYITTDLTIASQFKSSFSWRLYDFLKAHYGFWYKDFTKQELMQLFNVQDMKSYVTNTNNLKQKALDVSISEINTLTEYKVHYKEQKEGRAIVGFTLIWTVGETTKKCTKAQIEAAERVCETILDQALEWIDLQGKEARERAKMLVRRSQEISLQIVPNLTAARLAELQDTLQTILSELERLKEKQEPENNESSVFYNWLDERE